MVTRVQLDVSHVSRGVTVKREKVLRYIRNSNKLLRYARLEHDPAGNSNVEESLCSTLCPVYATASSAESPSEPSLGSPDVTCKTHRRRL